MQERSISETISLLAIQRLQAAYGDAVTRRAWDELRELFTPDATVEIDTRTRELIRLDGAEEIATFVANAVGRFAFFEFTLLNAVADLDDDLDEAADGERAVGRVYICELRHESDGAWSQAYGLYQDQYLRTGDRWRIAARRYSSLARRGATTESFELPSIDDWPS